MLTRRAFLRRAGLAATAIALPGGSVLADRLAPFRLTPPVEKPVRVLGRVSGDGRGIPDVAVSDGHSVVRTDERGDFELPARRTSGFVFVTLPAGYEIERSETGTARFYEEVGPEVCCEIVVDFRLRRLAVPDDEHAFLVLADPQTLDDEDMAKFRTQTIPQVRRTAQQMGGRELFGVSCGDIMFDRLELFPDYEAAVAESGIPFFQVLGNHDVEVATRTDELSATVFRKRFGPTYYSFERGEIHYVVLDDVFWYGDYVGYIDQEQLDWLHADLSLVEPGRTVVVFAHIPVYCRFHERQGRPDAHAKAVVSNRDLLYAILEPYRSYILCGHMHETEFLEDGGSEIHVCGAACGAWWSGPICRDGTPKGYMVYEAAGGDLRWRYQSTGMPPRHQMRLYRPGAEKEAPELLIANVWGADDRWKIRWIEDGVPRGPMKRRRGLDPLSVNLHSGEDLPAKHGWVEPVMTDHLYAARPSPGAKEIFVEAEDPWGEVYREKLII